MKISTLTKALFASAIALGVTALPFSLPASAQVDPAPAQTDTDTEDDGFDWGLLGLLGLIGLAGLARKPEERTVYRDPRTETTTRSDYTNPR